MRFQSLLSRLLLPNQPYKPNLHEYKGYSLCTIEFDDQGEFWDPNQLDKTIEHIQEKCNHRKDGSASKESDKSGEVIVITFAHGWMHNASPEDKNFQKFAERIGKRAEAEAEFAKAHNRPQRPIIGVYLAWRGLHWN